MESVAVAVAHCIGKKKFHRAQGMPCLFQKCVWNLLHTLCVGHIFAIVYHLFVVLGNLINFFLPKKVRSLLYTSSCALWSPWLKAFNNAAFISIVVWKLLSRIWHTVANGMHAPDIRLEISWLMSA